MVFKIGCRVCSVVYVSSCAQVGVAKLVPNWDSGLEQRFLERQVASQLSGVIKLMRTTTRKANLGWWQSFGGELITCA